MRGRTLIKMLTVCLCTMSMTLLCPKDAAGFDVAVKNSSGQYKSLPASIKLKVKQSVNKIKVTGLEADDEVISWKSSNTNIVKVNRAGKITAQSKSGKAIITVTLKSGAARKITVSVQKKPVTCTKISLNKKSVTLKTGKTFTLKPSVKPVTCVQKIKYSSSDKNVATVSGKGKITAKNAGKATITVTVGKKKAKCTITVSEEKTAPVWGSPCRIELYEYTGGGHGTPQSIRTLAADITGMQKKKNSMYPDMYYTGNGMEIGLNMDAHPRSWKNQYLYIRNSGNRDVIYCGIEIGESKKSVLEKFEKMRYVTYDNGKSYSNANAFSFYPEFSGRKLTAYTYICAPTG